jgi:hypothetical protein
MSANKKLVRKAFRDSTWKRDGYKCICCGFKSSPANAEQELDAHHITSRDEMPNGGYVKENGATLCKGENGCSCHEKAEMVLHGDTIPGFSPDDLYSLIGSTREQAIKASEKL